MAVHAPAPADPTPDSPAGAAQALRHTAAVRERARALLQRARRGASDAFAVDDSALPQAARIVADLTRARFPDGRIPYHSRWRHFEAGGVDRAALLDQRLDAAAGPAGASVAERARARIDLALVSVLLDAGAGADWAYLEADGGRSYGRSEGLGVASFHAFTQGLFSSDPQQPLRADAAGLSTLTPQALAQAFQVRADNPLVGLDGRVALLQRLGQAMAAQPDTYGSPARPGGLYDALLAPAPAARALMASAAATAPSVGAATPAPTIRAHAVLERLLGTLSSIWPSSPSLQGVPMGDCWPHPAVRGPGLTDGWMPLHKLSQWLTYSLLEPLAWAGVTVQGLDALTGLPEYRNGGLLVDSGVLKPLPLDAGTRAWPPGDPFIVEWRALTVALLDELAPMVRTELGLSEAQMPLACVLEGGTWAAGRLLAQRLRGGAPPIAIDSDGTVF